MQYFSFLKYLATLSLGPLEPLVWTRTALAWPPVPRVLTYSAFKCFSGVSYSVHGLLAVVDEVPAPGESEVALRSGDLSGVGFCMKAWRCWWLSSRDVLTPGDMFESLRYLLREFGKSDTPRYGRFGMATVLSDEVRKQFLGRRGWIGKCWQFRF